MRREFETNFRYVTKFYESSSMDFIGSPFKVDVTSLTLAITRLCPANYASLEIAIVKLKTNDKVKAELRAGVGHFGV